MQNYGINLGNEPRDKKSDATLFRFEEELPTIPIITLIDGFQRYLLPFVQLCWEFKEALM